MAAWFRWAGEFLWDWRRALSRGNLEDVPQRTSRTAAYIQPLWWSCHLSQWVYTLFTKTLRTPRLRTNTLDDGIFSVCIHIVYLLTKAWFVCVSVCGGFFWQGWTVHLKLLQSKACWCHFLRRTMHHCASSSSFSLRSVKQQEHSLIHSLLFQSHSYSHKYIFLDNHPNLHGFQWKKTNSHDFTLNI